MNNRSRNPQQACPPGACGPDVPVPACTLHSTFVGPWLAALIFSKHRLVVRIVAVVAACISAAKHVLSLMW